MSRFGDGLDKAVQKAFTRPAPKSAGGAQMRLRWTAGEPSYGRGGGAWWPPLRHAAGGAAPLTGTA